MLNLAAVSGEGRRDLGGGTEGAGPTLPGSRSSGQGLLAFLVAETQAEQRIA